ncbi:MAG: hypothetical protein HC902_03175 [Calothrix sp. SM1_5_4]|nr:hypothetical protein [Calothrix sp. SM1_5_4]
MAARSFLLEEDFAEGLRLLSDGVSFPRGVREVRLRFSLWLEDRLLRRLRALGPFDDLKPVLLGSWSRHELTPKSDIDILFVGPEADVKEFVGQAFRQGLKLRARTPERARTGRSVSRLSICWRFLGPGLRGRIPTCRWTWASSRRV